MKAKIIILVLLVIAIGICVLPYSTKINKTVDGGLYRIGDSSEYKPSSVHVEGTYRSYLLRNDTFDGYIEISNLEQTKESKVYTLIYRDGFANLMYNKSFQGMPDHYVAGAILNDRDFRNILILVDEPINGDSKSWSGDGGLFIVAPSDTRNEALDRAKSLSKKSHWLEEMEWE